MFNKHSRDILYFNKYLARLKATKRKHHRKSVTAMLDFLNDMGFLNGPDIVSVDGINFNGRDNFAKYGRSLHGHEASVLQISINGVSFAAIAAMSDEGFIAWTINDGAVCGSHVVQFIRTKVIPRLRHSY